MVVRKPGVGTVITNGAVDLANAGVGSRLADDTVTLIRIMDFRAAIEPQIASRAAERASNGDVETMQALVAAMASVDTPPSFVELDEQFHRSVAEATRNPLLVDLVDVSARWLRPSRADAVQSAERREASMAGHRAILDAIAGGNGTAAAKAMADHVLGVAAILQRQG